MIVVRLLLLLSVLCILPGALRASDVTNDTSECGMGEEFTFDERIAECNSFRDRDGNPVIAENPMTPPDNAIWAQVMQTSEGRAYWYDRASKLIWSPPLPGNQYPQAMARQLCLWQALQDKYPEAVRLGTSWRLPRDVEFEDPLAVDDAVGHGLMNVVLTTGELIAVGKGVYPLFWATNQTGRIGAVLNTGSKTVEGLPIETGASAICVTPLEVTFDIEPSDPDSSQL